jgi:hypothetical protein
MPSHTIYTFSHTRNEMAKGTIGGVSKMTCIFSVCSFFIGLIFRIEDEAEAERPIENLYKILFLD